MEENNNDILNVGLVGHIDHGKTTLLYKLSGKWTDTHSEELKRGITIKLGYADVAIYEDNGKYNIEGKGHLIRKVSFIDAPGHEMLMATMLSGVALIDAAILVIAANEGIKPQTKEHLMALQAKGVKKIIIAQNKIDLVSKETAQKNYQDIKNFIKGKYDDAPIIPVSAQQGINVDLIWKKLCEIEVPKRDVTSDPIFFVARSFDVNKPGTTSDKLSGAVLGGILKKGVLKVGDEIEIKPGKIVKEANKFAIEPLYTKIRSLVRFGKYEKELTPGGSSAIETSLDMILGKSDALAGNIVSLRGKLPPMISTIKIRYELFTNIFEDKEKKVEDFKVGEAILLSINTIFTGGNIEKVHVDKIEVKLKKPVIVFKDDRVGIARNMQNHWRLIGWGNVLID